MRQSKKSKHPEQKRAWDEFARYIKVRDCLRTTGLPFVGACITCNRKYHIRYLEAGHCIPGRTNSKLFNQNLVNAQCHYCNFTKHGDRKKYEAVIIERHGAKWFEVACRRARKVVIDHNINWENRAKRYKRMYEKIMRKHGYKTYGELLAAERS